MRELRWYGWGYSDKTYPLDHRPGAWNFLRSTLQLRGDEEFPICDFDSIQLRAPRLTKAQLGELGDITFQIAKRARIGHAYGKSYRDLVRLRRGDIPNPPDAVIYPADENQITQVIRWCANHDYALIPFGGGSSVVGGVEPRDERITVSLDLARLNHVLALDEISQTATIEAGILGPDLERELNARGFTLGHFPQSFEFSTLGGWIATRGAGLSSTRYGKIEAMTVNVRVATPSGIIETRKAPATAAGPWLMQWLIGSEGTLGVITRATMRVRPLPKMKDYRALMFKSFGEGVAAIRTMLQNDIVPATVRLSDEEETRSFFALREAAQGWKGVAENFGLRVLSILGYSFTHGALMILGFEGDKSVVQSEGWSGITACESHGAFDLGHGIARAWLRDRYETPYLRDVLMDRGILVDTLETATTWENLESLRKKLTQAITRAAETTGSRALVMTHVSHCYRDGASLYVSFLARIKRGEEIEQWTAIKRAATDCIMAAERGGTLSHHHGVGYEHAPWMEQEIGAGGLDALRAVKNALDPTGIMNPGKILVNSKVNSKQ